MKVSWTPAAFAKLDAQIDYLIEQQAVASAQNLAERIDRFLTDVLAVFPRNGLYVDRYDVYETWIPKTKIVLWYRFDDDALTIIDLWHTSQDREQR